MNFRPQGRATGFRPQGFRARGKAVGKKAGEGTENGQHDGNRRSKPSSSLSNQPDRVLPNHSGVWKGYAVRHLRGLLGTSISPSPSARPSTSR